MRLSAPIVIGTDGRTRFQPQMFNNHLVVPDHWIDDYDGGSQVLLFMKRHEDQWRRAEAEMAWVSILPVNPNDDYILCADL